MEYAILFLPLLGALTGYYGKFLGSLFSEIITVISPFVKILIFDSSFTLVLKYSS